jgi:hypothetical protein
LRKDKQDQSRPNRTSMRCQTRQEPCQCRSGNRQRTWGARTLRAGYILCIYRIIADTQGNPFNRQGRDRRHRCLSHLGAGYETGTEKTRKSQESKPRQIRLKWTMQRCRHDADPTPRQHMEPCGRNSQHTPPRVGAGVLDAHRRYRSTVRERRLPDDRDGRGLCGSPRAATPHPCERRHRNPPFSPTTL